MGWGGGRGRGWRHRRCVEATGLTGWQRAEMSEPEAGARLSPAIADEQELSALKQQAESLERALSDLKARINELGNSTSDTTRKEEG